MLHTLFVYLHLLATCAAIGIILTSDLRILSHLAGYRVVIPPPQRLDQRMIIAALVGLYLTGAVLLWQGHAGNPGYLSNPKLQAKLALVGLLTLNAFVLHRRIFPLLDRGQPVSMWSRAQRLGLAASVAMSNSLWFYCAFLGVARPWNDVVSVSFVLGIALAVWVAMFALVHVGLGLASREQPKAVPDWVDMTIASIGDKAGATPVTTRLGGVRGANQSQYGDLQLDRRDAGRPDRRRAGRY